MWLASGGAAWVFAAFALQRHRSFESRAYDFAFFDQIIWNTAHGRWFDTTFLSYNFLGQHFQPVLLVFALAYRLGAGPETLLIAQALFAGAAAVPLYYAVRKLSGSGLAGVALAAGYLLSAPLHNALDFDFHPELLGMPFIFLALYYLAARRPLATVATLLPLLLLKEDMPLVLAAFALLLFAAGFRTYALALFTTAVAYAVAVVIFLMPLVRGGSGDLTERYGYLTSGSSSGALLPHVVARAFDHLTGSPLHALVELYASGGFVLLLSPLALAASLPSTLVAALADHPQQFTLDLHYVVAPLALMWVGVALAVRDVRRGDGALRALRRAGSGGARVLCLSAIVLGASAFAFYDRSPYRHAPELGTPESAHLALLRQAVALVPADASVSAQTTIAPHLSQRRRLYEFPDLEDAQYVVIDRSLAVAAQSRDAGYDEVASTLTRQGFETVFDEDSVQVFRRTQ